jgi:hypothetical protein
MKQEAFGIWHAQVTAKRDDGVNAKDLAGYLRFGGMTDDCQRELAGD